MKKIFAIIGVLVMSVSAFATHYNYNPTEITSFKISDDSYGNDYAYTITIEQSGLNGSWYDSEATIYLYPKTHSMVGEFTLEDRTLDSYSYVYYNGGTRYFIEGDSYWSSNNTTKITITDNGDGTYTFGGVVICENSSGSNAYRYIYTDYEFSYEEEGTDPDPEGDPYENEPSDKKNITWSSTRLQVYTGKGETPISMYASNSDWSEVELLFNVDSYDIPAGDYEISTSGATGTITAGNGSYYTPSYFYTADYTEYYLVSGTLTVSYADGDMMIKGTATTAHGSTVALTLTGKDPFGHLLVNPVTFEANEDGETATVTGLDPTFTGTALTIPGTVAINGKNCTVTAIADQAFTKETGLQSIVIPATVEVIGKAAFSFCTGLTTIECQGSVAPSAGASAFYKINPAISVVVPSSAVNSYKAADGWKMFTNISAK